MHYKSIPQYTKEINGRSVTGVFAVHGNLDSYNDISVNGSFAQRLLDGSRKRARFLWNHMSSNPPIASIKEIREIGRDELPEQVLQHAPDATGGVLVTREYYEGVELANWVLSGIKAGDIDEMSYAYDVHKMTWEDRDGKQIRLLQDVEIFDISDVNWGANPATAAVKGMPGSAMPFAMHGEAVETTIAEYVERLKNRREFRAKEGRTLSTSNRNRIKSLVESLTAVKDDLVQLLVETEPKADPLLITQTYAEFQHIVAKLNGAIAS